ncbi:MAG: alanine--glyoxylate aminotransferase family protein [bacterium]|jgi:aspartate aminotransferase-like enzyme
MKKVHLFTPGPTMVPGDVALAGAKDMIHHRTDEFKVIYDKVAAALKKIFVTENPVLVLMSTGTGAMEAAVSNLIGPGEKMITFNGGKFGERWGKIGKAYDCVVHEVKYGWDDCSSIDKLEKAISECPDAVAIFTQLNETASGIRNPIREMAEVAHNAGMMIVVDGISGLTAMECPMDAWGLDVLLSGSQKGFMLPPGLAFISLNPKATEKVNNTKRRAFYFNLQAAIKNDADHTHPWTSNVSLYQQLAVALDMILEEGLENVIHRCHIQGEAVRSAAKSLGFEILNAKSPGDVLTPILLPESVPASKVAKYVRGNWGVYFAAGQDEYKDKILRIGHLGYQDHFDTIMAVAAFEMAMKKFGVDIELGKGVKVAEEILLEDLIGSAAKAAAG